MSNPNEQPPSNPAGPAVSQQGDDFSSADITNERNSAPAGHPEEGVPTQQPAEAVSEAAREAALTEDEIAAVRDEIVWGFSSQPPLKRKLIQSAFDKLRAITAATAAQQAEIAALREEVEKYRFAASVLCGAHIGTRGRLNKCPMCDLEDTLQVRDALSDSLTRKRKEWAEVRAELATTRERLARYENPTSHENP